MKGHMEMEFDLDTLTEVFGEPHKRHSHPDRGNYWFDYRRPDGVVVRLVVDVVGRVVSVGVDCSAGVGTSLHLEKCDRVRVLEVERRTIEVVGAGCSIRCFIALDGETVMTVEAPAVVS